MNQQEIEEFEKWVKMWPFASKCTESVLRKITKGPMVQLFSEFFVKKCRSDDWITTANSNFFVEDHKESEEFDEEDEESTRQHNAEMAKMQKKYDALCLKEDRLIKEAFEKQKRLPRRHLKGKGKLSRKDLKMVHEVNRRYAEIAERKAKELVKNLQTKMSDKKSAIPTSEGSNEEKAAANSSKLDSLKADILEIYLAGLAKKHKVAVDNEEPGPSSNVVQSETKANTADVEQKMLDVLKSNISPSEIKEWIRENVLKNIEKITLRMKEEKEQPNILETFESKIASWSSMHLDFEMESNHLLEEIAKEEETIADILKEDPEQLELATLMIEEFKLNEELKFYEQFEEEPFINLIEEKIAEFPVPDFSAEVKDPVDDSMEDQLVSVITSWPQAKFRVRETQAATKRLYSEKFPKLCQLFNKFLESRIKDIQNGSLFGDADGNHDSD